MSAQVEANSTPVLAALLRSRNLAADDALVAALPLAEPDRRSEILHALIARDHESAHAGVVALYGTVDDALDTLLREHGHRLSAGIRLAIAHDQFEIRRAAIELISANGDGKLGYLLAEALKQHCRRTVQLAADALAALANASEKNPSEVASSRAASSRGPTGYLVVALRHALGSWPLHFRPEIVVAAARLAVHLESTILKVADDARLNLARAFNNALDGSRDPRLVAYCLRAMRSSSLRAAASRMLMETRDPDFRQALLDQSWILADETVRRSCARLRSIACLRDDGTILQSARAGYGRSAVRLIGATGGRSSFKLTLLRKLAVSGHTETARAAIWWLIDNDAEETTELLRGLEARKDVPLGEVIQCERRRRTHGSRHSAVPTLATAIADSEAANEPTSAFDPYWDGFDSLTDESRRSIGLQVADGMDDFNLCVRARLRSNNPADRVRALRIVQLLKRWVAFEDDIHAAAQDSDNTVRSLAVSLLGALDGKISRRLLRSALEDSDERVQANAIESIESLGATDEARHVISKLDSSASRVRANAIKAMMSLGIREAAQNLVDMLESNTPADRISALWVIERMQLSKMVARIETMVERDQDPQVRTRARRLMRRFGDSATLKSSAQAAKEVMR